MRKMLIAVMMLMAGMVLAEPLEFFEFNDAAGTSFDNGNGGFVNSGSNSNVWNYGGNPGMKTDGNGILVVTNVSPTQFRKLPKEGTGTAAAGSDTYATPYTTGKYRVEVDFSGWVMEGTNSFNNVLGFGVMSGNSIVAQVRLMKNKDDAAWIQLAGVEAGAVKYNTYGQALSSAAGALAVIEFDFDNDTIEYFIDGVSKKSDNTFSAASFDEVRFYTGNEWSTNSVVGIDSMGLSVIPEPATLGLVAFCGGGLLLLRRKIMM